MLPAAVIFCISSMSAACTTIGNAVMIPVILTRSTPFLRIESINSLLYVFSSFVIVTELLHMLRLLLYHPHTLCQVFLLFSSISYVPPCFPFVFFFYFVTFCYIYLSLLTNDINDTILKISIIVIIIVIERRMLWLL